MASSEALIDPLQSCSIVGAGSSSADFKLYSEPDLSFSLLLIVLYVLFGFHYSLESLRDIIRRT